MLRVPSFAHAVISLCPKREDKDQKPGIGAMPPEVAGDDVVLGGAWVGAASRVQAGSRIRAAAMGFRGGWGYWLKKLARSLA